MSQTVYVMNEDTRYFSIKYEDGGVAAKKAELEGQWLHFNRLDPTTGQTLHIWYRPTNRKQEVQVDRLMPQDAAPGRYKVEAFIPGQHATTRKAIFTVANSFRKENGVDKYEDTVVVVDMFDKFDVWVPLGEYDLDPKTNPLSGRVRQYDITMEDPPVAMAFGPIRWVPVLQLPAGAAKFDAPIGTEPERAAGFIDGMMMWNTFPVWVGKWYDANPFLSWYSQGYHTGADLNLPGSSDADKDAPIYAISDGQVTYAGAAGSWGNIVVVYHPNALVTLPSGVSQFQPVYSRYGHVSDRILVKAGDVVTRGQNIAFVGLQANFVTGWHLHFDVNYSGIFKSRPAHWPNMTEIRALQAAHKEGKPEFKAAQVGVKQEVVANYVDPLRFIKDNHR